MLDENLPTFIFRPMPDHPSSAVVYFTRSGSDPAPEYVLRLADPVSMPACRGVYAAALTDPYNSDGVVYGEVGVTPEWQMPSLSAAELREHRERGNEAAAAAPTAKTPDSFVVQLYNPDQAFSVRWTPGSWNKTESWEFDMPIETFRMPSASRLDRQAASSTAAEKTTNTPTPPPLASTNIVTPKNTFRWKRDGRLGNKDMTCYLVGQTVGLHRSKEPDITVALFKHGRDPAVTIYEPNLQRVDVQDRKGLDLMLLLSTQVIRDLYLVPRADPFNMEGAAAGAAAAAAAGKRKNSRPTAAMSAVSLPSGAANQAQQQQQRPLSAYNAPTTSAATIPSSTPSAAAIDAETKRLQAMLEREERERARREREEEKRIKKMLEAEDKERRRREAEVAKETERLRKLYGVEGQELPSKAAPHSASSSSKPPPSSSSRPVPPPPPPAISGPYHPYAQGSSQGHYQQPPPPPRPVSAGPSHHSTLQSWWNGPSAGYVSVNNNSSNNKKSSAGGGGGGGFLSNPAANISGFFSSSSAGPRDRSSSATGDRSNNRIQKKRSVHF